MSPKQKLNVKCIGEKSQPLKDLESGLPNKEVIKKYGVPKNTVQLGLETKHCILLHWNNLSVKEER